MSQPALIIGAGGHARVVGAILRALDIPIAGYLDTSYQPGVQEIIKYAALIGQPADLNVYDASQYRVYAAIGDNQKRREAVEQALKSGYAMPSLTHPASQIEIDCVIGTASTICMGALLATEVVVGQGVIINTGSSIDHESAIGDFSHIAPRAVLAGRVKVGREVFIGMGVCVAQGLSIGDQCVIGAGAIILKDVPPQTRVVGIYH